jgi:hypothetical protein
MQNIILGIACTNTPEQARIVLIDPKLGVDYFAFEGYRISKAGSSTNRNAPLPSWASWWMRWRVGIAS